MTNRHGSAEENYQSLSERIATELTWKMFSGALAPGERLIETEIAEEYGVSRGPVREAMKQLEQIGLLLATPHRGAVVARVSDDEAALLVELRAIVEGFAIREAVRNVSRKDIAYFQELVGAMSEAAEQRDARAFIRLDVQFHDALMQLAESNILVRLWRSMDGPVRVRVSSKAGESHVAISPATVEEHRRIVKALEMGDAFTAERAVVEHIRHVHARPRRMNQGS